MAWYWIALIIESYLLGLVMAGALMVFADSYPLWVKAIAVITWPIGVPLLLLHNAIFP